jgi:hypothetical protein
MVTTQSAPVPVNPRSIARQKLARRRVTALLGCILLGMTLFAGGLVVQDHRSPTSAPAIAQPAQPTNWRFLERNQLPETTGAPAPVAVSPVSAQAIRFLELNDLSTLDSTATPMPATVVNWRFQEQNEILPSSTEVTPEHGPR